jgi:hypothetical protein
MTRLYSSISVETILSAGITSSQTSMVVATGTGSTLLGGVTLAAGNVDQFTVAIDPDTVNEEIVFITANSGDTFTIVRGRSGSTAITHASGATVRHVMTSNDLDYFNTAVQPSTLTTKGDTYVATASATVTRLAAGSNGQVLTADSTDAKGIKWATPASGSVTSVTAGTGLSGGTITTTGTIAIDSTVATLAGSQTLTNKVLLSPEERTTVSATAATGTVNFDASTQGVLYYTTNASANWTLNIRGTSSATLSSILAVGDAITVTHLVTQGSTAYYNSAVQVDGSSVTPKWQGGTAPTAGNASSVDAYVYTVVKTAATPTYTVFASQTKFA